MKIRALIIVFALLASSCATYKSQFAQEANIQTASNKPISYTFYLMGDAGNAKINESTSALKAFQQELSKADANSMALFLGDNIYEKGMPKADHSERAIAEHRLNVQLDAVRDYKGKTVFVPGNHDWYSDGLKGLKRQEKYVEEALGKNTFQPENGCPIKRIKINDDVVVLAIDSQWYLANWDKHPTINDDCEIKTREDFFAEFESQLKKNQGKTIVVAIHHPMDTNGSHGGQFALGKHLFPFQTKVPLPIIGSLINLTRKTGGVSPQDLQNVHYRTLSKRLLTLAQESDNVVLVSGHDHSLQYLKAQNIPQIISGSGSKGSAASIKGDGVFSYGGPGYAKMMVYEDGSVQVQFFGEENNFSGPMFTTNVIDADQSTEMKEYPSSFPATASASVYTEEETSKGGVYRALWGSHYRAEYSTEVNVPTASLDTLLGGLTPIRKGGGHQSKSLRLVDKDGRQYVMRALRKSAVRFLQAVAFKDQYIKDDFSDTYSEDLLLDFYTVSHPYASFVVGDLADAAKVFHTNPTLYYIPKQKALGSYNDTYGDELYMIEERVTSGHGSVASFGNSNEIISTPDLLKKLRRRDKNDVDQKAYIRARLFDMMIGDWDRHEDQWRWAEFDEQGKKIYRPVPRDRDQAFSNFDGFLLGIFTRIVPGLRLMQTYGEEMRSVKWFNDEPFPLDMAIIIDHSWEDWEEQADYLINNVTDEVIDRAFLNMPTEVRNLRMDEIKMKLRARRGNMKAIAKEYYQRLKQCVIVTGTDKDDHFEVARMPDGKTNVKLFRIQGGKKGTVVLDETYDKEETKEIWLYGLDDEDVFEVKGSGDNLIKLRLVGGQNNDSYDVTNTSRMRVYDYKSKKNTFVSKQVPKRLTDQYDVNTYHFKKTKKYVNQLVPIIGANPDDGLKVGLNNTLSILSLHKKPFSQKHNISAAYYFATQGFDVRYNGEFANVFDGWNFGIEGVFTSPNFAINYFGFGNETTFDDDAVDFDFNRVKLSTVKIAPSLIWRGHSGGFFSFGGTYESIEVEDTVGRFINTTTDVSPLVFEAQNLIGVEATYGFENFDNASNPTLGMQFLLTAGYKTNLDESDNSFGYVVPSLSYTSKLNANGTVVLATKFKGNLILGDDIFFYQAATIGGNDGLRGFRHQRFTGKYAFYQNTDLRFNVTKFKTGLVPMKLGLYGGADYGRVWEEDDSSRQWHNSFGGGLYLNAVETFTANFSLFNSRDGNRFAFAVGFNF